MRDLTLLVFAYFICAGIVAWSLVNHFDDKQKFRDKRSKALIYESGYIRGALSGAKFMADSITYKDWLEIKKQDSIEFDSIFINKE